MQCLTNFIMQDTIYKGVVIAQKTLKFIMFADDILLFLLGTTNQLSCVFANLHEFSNHSNCKINLCKCQAFQIDINKNWVDYSLINL